MNGAQSEMALTSVAKSTTVTTSMSFCTLGTTTMITAVSSAGSGGSVVTSVDGSINGSTLQRLAVTLSTLSARMDNMEYALHAHAAPPAPGPPPAPASPTGVAPTAAGQPYLDIHPSSPTRHRPNGRSTHGIFTVPADPTPSAVGQEHSSTRPRCSPSSTSLKSCRTSSAWVGLAPTTHQSPINLNPGTAGSPRTLWYGRWICPISMCLRDRRLKQVSTTR